MAVYFWVRFSVLSLCLFLSVLQNTGFSDSDTCQLLDQVTLSKLPPTASCLIHSVQKKWASRIPHDLTSASFTGVPFLSCCFSSCSLCSSHTGFQIAPQSQCTWPYLQVLPRLFSHPEPVSFRHHHGCLLYLLLVFVCFPSNCSFSAGLYLEWRPFCLSLCFFFSS